MFLNTVLIVRETVEWINGKQEIKSCTAEERMRGKRQTEGWQRPLDIVTCKRLISGIGNSKEQLDSSQRYINGQSVHGNMINTLSHKWNMQVSFQNLFS